jgi:UDP-N-acetylglucosamine/UDP-N-acetylgalactosamine diphosphorylase
MRTRPFAIGVYRGIERIVENNLLYIGNLWALRAWYQNVRMRTMSSDAFIRACHAGALNKIDEALKERIQRMKELAGNMPYSIERARAETGKDLPPGIQTRQRALADRWHEMESRLKSGPAAEAGAEHRDAFLAEWEKMDAASGHIKAVAALSLPARRSGAAWLQNIVESASAFWKKP